MRQTVVQIVLNARNLTGAAFKAVGDQARRLGAELKAMTTGVQGAFAALGASLTAGGLLSYLYRVNAEWQTLGTRVRTFTATEAEAAATMRQLTSLAAELPFELSNVTEAFITLKSAGVNPTMETMRRYADTAAAFGGSIEEMAEAVRAAATGEMERLKRFGVVARLEGDTIKASFRGQTTEIDRTAVAVANYLETLSADNFAGGATRQMQTLTGATSNLQDAFFRLGTTIGDAGLTAALYDAAKAATQMTEDVEGSRAQVFYWTKLTISGVLAVGKTLWGTVKLAFQVGYAIGQALRSAFVVGKLAIGEFVGGVYGAIGEVAGIINDVFGTELKVPGADAVRRFRDGAREGFREINAENEALFRDMAAGVVRIGEAWVETGYNAVYGMREAEAASRETAAAAQAAAGALAEQGLASAMAAEQAAAAAADEKARKAFEDRLKLLLEATKYEGTRAAAVAELVALEARLADRLDEGTLALERRVEIEAQRRAIQDATGLGARPDELRVPAVQEAPVQMRGLSPADGAAALALPEPDVTPIEAYFEAMVGGARDAAAEIGLVGTELDRMVATGVAAFADSWTNAFLLVGEGAQDAGAAIINATRGAIADSAMAKSRESAIDAARALAEGLTNPAKLVQAAKLFAVSAGYATLAGMLGRGAGGRAGRGGGGGFGGRAEQDRRRFERDESVGTIYVQGGLINLNDPRQAEEFANAVNRLGRERRIDIVGVPTGRR